MTKGSKVGDARQGKASTRITYGINEDSSTFYPKNISSDPTKILQAVGKAA